MKIALQLYSIVNISEERGICASLDKAKEWGYDGVEFAGTYHLSPEQLKEALDKRGLKCAGFHVGYDQLFDNPEKALRLAQICGAYSLCLPSYLADTIEEWASLGEKLDRIGEKFHQQGIKFGYHNHQQEYENLNGKYPIDVLLEKCKTENVFFEMDTLHVAAAGESPVKFAEKYARRIPILHARDTDGTNDCTIGSGMLDFPTILSVCSTLEWIVVENCNIGFNEKELADSATYLRQILK